MSKTEKNDRLHLVIHSKITLSYLIGFLLSYLSYVLAGIHLETSFFSYYHYSFLIIIIIIIITMMMMIIITTSYYNYFFRADFTITFHNYKKPINANAPMKLHKNSDTK